MIEFKIITSPDRSQQATYRHLGTELVMGRTTGDMIIDDPGFGDTQLCVRLEGGRATLENLDPSVEVRLNGKAISGAVPLKEKDNLTVARTTMNFSRLDTTPIPMPEPFEHPNAQERFAEGTKEKVLIEALRYLESQAPGASIAGSTPTPPGMPAKPPLPPGGTPKTPPPLPPGLPPLPKKP